ncbi:hypothetical protein JOQ06_024877 [Pogonophryne albipinna]|uniref:SET domain-containing protein n=1 Tax=Pogonophryne albipinna TaxID=1090488 RepID=A0AAD6ARG2_9TELE|nr:hypothetical protein JOQ06_024877 [Pogonophryne albipinna]
MIRSTRGLNPCQEAERQIRMGKDKDNLRWEHINKESIDASSEDGSMGRLVNDDPKPNAKMKKMEVDGVPQLCIFPVKDIMEEQEITYDYGGVDLPWRSSPGQEMTKATQLSTVDVTVLREDIQEELRAKFPEKTLIQIANNVCYSGTKHAIGMILANGSTGGLTDFGELIQIVVVKGTLVKCLSAWSVEHLRSYVLEKTQTVKVLEPAELSDMFPLTPYLFGGKSIVTLKRYIYVA